MSEHVHTIFISKHCASFHLWGKENLVKHQKVSKYYENDCECIFKCEKIKMKFAKNTKKRIFKQKRFSIM